MMLLVRSYEILISRINIIIAMLSPNLILHLLINFHISESISYSAYENNLYTCLFGTIKNLTKQF